MAGGDGEYWVIKIPKPRRVLRMLSKVLSGVSSLPTRQVTVDVPFTAVTSALIGVIFFLFFNIYVKMPEAVSLLFSAIIVAVYLVVLGSELRR